MKDDETRYPPPPRATALGVFVSLTAILAAASIQPARADTWDVPFLGDRIQVKAHPDIPTCSIHRFTGQGNQARVHQSHDPTGPDQRQ